MEAKNKAAELIDNLRMDNTAEGYRRGIKCAIVCVDEILEVLDNNESHWKFQQVSYWNEVRNELKECE